MTLGSKYSEYFFIALQDNIWIAKSHPHIEEVKEYTFQLLHKGHNLKEMKANKEKELEAFLEDLNTLPANFCVMESVTVCPIFAVTTA